MTGHPIRTLDCGCHTVDGTVTSPCGGHFPALAGEGERYASVSPMHIVTAIWDRWDRDLQDWDLGGSTANLEARKFALEAVAEVLEEHPG